MNKKEALTHALDNGKNKIEDIMICIFRKSIREAEIIMVENQITKERKMFSLEFRKGSNDPLVIPIVPEFIKQFMEDYEADYENLPD